MKAFSRFFFSFFLCLCLLLPFCAPVYAASKAEIDTMLAHLPEEWPESPNITSEAAILVDIDTDTILYAKNATSSMYPASTTKLMTAYLTLANTSLDDIVTFSKNSIYSLPSGSSHIGMHIGESLSVRDCLYGLLLPSANEVATALAEHVSGSVSAFVELMNSTAVELGCVNTNFANANGLQDPNHMTCAYDLYRIMQGCLQYSDFISISSTPAYYRTADDVLDRDIPMGTTNKLIKKDSEYYTSFVVCGKTGWTQEAGRCLVTYASKDGRNLICVTMNAEDPNQYKDTIQLFNYGFDHFSVAKAAEQDQSYSTQALRSNSPLGLSEQNSSFLTLDSASRVTVPDTVSLNDLTRRPITNDDKTQMLSYELHGYPLGTARIINQAAEDTSDLYVTSVDTLQNTIHTTPLHEIKLWLVICILVVVILILLLTVFLLRYNWAQKNKNNRPTPPNHQYRMQ